MLERAHLKLPEAILEVEGSVKMQDRFNWGGNRAIFVTVAMVDNVPECARRSGDREVG
jgi:hypothetical protein